MKITRQQLRSLILETIEESTSGKSGVVSEAGTAGDMPITINSLNDWQDNVLWPRVIKMITKDFVPQGLLQRVSALEKKAGITPGQAEEETVSEGNIDDAIERLDEKKKKPKSRGDVVFPAESSKVKDNKDHFPINSANQARNALARASQYSSAPGWYDGSLTDLVKTVQRKVKKKYKSIDTTSASENPGKG